MNTPDTIEGERSIPSVNAISSTRYKRGAVGLMFVATVAATGVMVYAKVIDKPDVQQEQPQRELPVASTVPARTFELPPEPEPVLEPKAEPEPLKVEPVHVQPVAPVAYQQHRPLRQLPPPPPTPTIDKSASRSAVAVNQPTSDTVAQALANMPTGGGFGGDSGRSNEPASGNSALGQQLQSTRLQSTTASRISNRDYLLTRGAFIDCVLQTKLVSSVPGMTSCRVTRDVFSSNGKVVLLDAGSLVTGEYSANLQQGMNRIFVLWSRVETPGGVIINLDSPGSDSLGAAGISGHVDTHFWQRFGGAMLLSLIDDAAQIAVNRSTSTNENAQVVLGSAASVPSELAAEVLRNTINIPPTLYANQGARVGIFVARDLDFSTVYSVQ
jgi:type IV secretion system protein VirB10